MMRCRQQGWPRNLVDPRSGARWALPTPIFIDSGELGGAVPQCLGRHRRGVSFQASIIRAAHPNGSYPRTTYPHALIIRADGLRRYRISANASSHRDLPIRPSRAMRFRCRSRSRKFDTNSSADQMTAGNTATIAFQCSSTARGRIPVTAATRRTSIKVLMTILVAIRCQSANRYSVNKEFSSGPPPSKRVRDSDSAEFSIISCFSAVRTFGNQKYKVLC